MRYRTFGKTGISISALGFGAMRLPMAPGADGQQDVKMDESVAILHRAFELGVNYVDTAYPYCNGRSEVAVGRALREWTGRRIYVSTKNPTWQVKQRGDYRRLLEEQLTRLGVEAIDFYHQHGIGMKSWEDVVRKYGLLDEARKAKDEGLIRHISFSFHDKPEVMKTFIDTGVFESLLCQFNLVDESNAEAMAYAKSKGLGVVVMGPLGGGRVIPPDHRDGRRHDAAGASPAQLALRFVLDHPSVDCAISGMSTTAMVEENAAAAGDDWSAAPEDVEKFRKGIEKVKALADLYCTGCGYCMPCPGGVNIPACFSAMNYLRVWKLRDAAKWQWKMLVDAESASSACTNCGACEEKCPQNIEIRKQLQEAAEALSKL
jgi:predicted aldo/keto reductase-like oxidoreductase